MMKGKGEEWGKPTPTRPTFILWSNKHDQTQNQTVLNKVTWSIYHLIITWQRRTIERLQYAALRSDAQSLFYHVLRKNNRMVPMHSNAQHCTVTPLSHAKKRTIEQSNAQQRAALHSHSIITWKGRTIEQPQCAALRSNHMLRESEATNRNNRRSGTIAVNLYLA